MAMFKGKAKLWREGLAATNLTFTNRRRQLPNTADMRKQNGPVKITKVGTLPHPFKCSKCAYIATDKTDFNDHWSLEH